MMGLFDFLAVPLGYIMRLVYSWIPNYFIAIFLFTLLMRILMFPLSLQSQKKQSDRIRLAPRLERLQKKYKNDPQKLQQKQQALYEKEGVSMTGGCMPMIVQMVVLFGIIAVIYKPLSFLSTVPKDVVNAAVAASSVNTYEANGDKTGGTYKAEDGTEYTVTFENKLEGNTEKDYYAELKMMKNMDANRADILFMIEEKTDCTADEAVAYFDEIAAMRGQFTFGKYSLLDNPWRSGLKDISPLWLIPLISGITAILVSVISQYFSKQGMSQEKMPGQGCSNFMMLAFMPMFSVYISFTVPGGVGIYWICSNVIALIQTVVLNLIYNPKKIREQAERDYEERRRMRAELKKKQQTLAEARRLDDEAERKADEEAAARAEEEKNAPKGKKGKKARDLNLEVGEMKLDDK